MKIQIVFVLSVFILVLFYSCSKQDISKEYQCSCHYSVQSYYGGGTQSGTDTVTVAATSTEDATNQCKSSDELSWTATDKVLSDDCSIIY